MLRIYYKATCSTCRTTLGLIQDETDEDPEIIEYMKDTPTKQEIKEILSLLGIKAAELVRKKEPIYLEKYAGKKITETQWIKILSENPELIERPIVVVDGKAIIARPPEMILQLLGKKKK